jgi:hypothetical protein
MKSARLLFGATLILASFGCSSVRTHGLTTIPMGEASFPQGKGLILIGSDLALARDPHISNFGCDFTLEERAGTGRYGFHLDPPFQGSVFALPPGRYDVVAVDCGRTYGEYGKDHPSNYSGFEVRAGELSFLGYWKWEREGLNATESPRQREARNFRVLKAAFERLKPEVATRLFNGYSGKTISLDSVDRTAR